MVLIKIHILEHVLYKKMSVYGSISSVATFYRGEQIYKINHSYHITMTRRRLTAIFATFNYYIFYITIFISTNFMDH